MADDTYSALVFSLIGNSMQTWQIAEESIFNSEGSFGYVHHYFFFSVACREVEKYAFQHCVRLLHNSMCVIDFHHFVCVPCCDCVYSAT